jgi:hypothetical protein
VTLADTRLVECAQRGEELDLADGGPVDLATVASWPASRQVSANVIRDLLRSSPDTAPRSVRLWGAHIVGELDLEAISTAVLLKLHDCYLPDGVVARDATIGLLRLHGCRVQRPITAERLVATVLVLTDTVVIGHDPDGAVELRGARLGWLDCDGASLTNDLGSALQGESLRLEFGMSLRGCVATGAGIDGAVCLLGAHAPRVECDGARLRNLTGPAFRADSLVVDQRAFLRRGFSAEGSGPIGAVRLNGARLGLFSCDGATLRNPAGPAVVAESMQVERAAFFGPGLIAEGHGPEGVVRLTGTRITGRLRLDADGLRNTVDGGPLVAVDGLTYTGLPEDVSVARWLQLLAGSATYTPQPYQQIAAGCRTAGQEREARTVLIAQRRDELNRGHLPTAVRAWIRLTSFTLGYGYRPWRALACLAGVALVSVILALALGGAGGLAEPNPNSGPCTVVERVGVGFDLSIPLVTTGARDRCDVTDAAAGQWLMVTGWALQLLGWAFATLFVAGFTGAVRRPGSG